MKQSQLNPMQRAYVTAAFWSSTDDEGEPLDAKYSIEDIDPETLKRMMKDCDDFEAKIMPILELSSDEERRECSKDWTDFGHDFWLTRNHHGAGFWDGDYPSEMGEKLTDIAQSFKECDLYISDDGKVCAV